MTHTRLPETWHGDDRFMAVFDRASACGFIINAEKGLFCRPDEPGQWRSYKELEAEYSAWVAVYSEPCLLRNGHVCPDAEWWEE